MIYEMKNFKNLKIEKGCLIIEWGEDDCCNAMSFSIKEIQAIGIDPRIKQKNKEEKL